MNIRWRERTNKMQLTRCLLSNFMSQHVSDIIMTIIRRIRPFPTACGVLPECAGCGWLWSCGAVSWVVCTVHSAHSSRRILLVLSLHLIFFLSSRPGRQYGTFNLLFSRHCGFWQQRLSKNTLYFHLTPTTKIIEAWNPHYFLHLHFMMWVHKCPVSCIV